MDKIKNIFTCATVGLFILILLNSCHKYPEDPFISFKRPWVRILGTWKITSYQINGTEHAHDFDSLLYPSNLYECSLSFEVGKTGQKGGQPYFKDKDGKVLFYDGGDRYGFPSLQIIDISIVDTLFNETFWTAPKVLYTGPYHKYYTSARWTIRKLYKNDLHIRKDNTDIYLKKK